MDQGYEKAVSKRRNTNGCLISYYHSDDNCDDIVCVSGTGLRALHTIILQKTLRWVQLFTFCNGESPI